MAVYADEMSIHNYKQKMEAAEEKRKQKVWRKFKSNVTTSVFEKNIFSVAVLFLNGKHFACNLKKGWQKMEKGK